MRLPEHAAPAAGQAAAHRHRAAGDAGGAGQRLRQPAPLQCRVPAALPHEPERAAQRRRADDAKPRLATTRHALRLAYRPPYDIDGVLRFLAQRALPGIESGRRPGAAAHAALAHQGQSLPGWLRGRFVPQRHELQLRCRAGAAARGRRACMQRLRHALDLDADPALIDPALATLPVPPPRACACRAAMDGFETAVRVILGQQVTVAAARTLTRRLVAALRPAASRRRSPTSTGCSPAPTTSPRPTRDASAGWASCASACAALQALARAVADGRIELHRGAPLAGHAGRAARAARHRRMDGAADRHARARLARRLCRHRHRRAQRAAARATWPSAQAQAEAWRPWRAYAVMGLWQTLEDKT